MRNSRLRLLMAACGAACLWAGAAGAQPAPAPALAIYNANIVTVDAKFSKARAALIRGGKFVAVGSDADILKQAGPGVTKMDMHGKTVLPGFNDTHQHQMQYGILFANAIDLTHVRSIAEIKKLVAERVKKAKPGEWITGTRGWWEYQMAEGRLPDAHDLDEVSPNNPVGMPGPHLSVVNSAALKVAGVTKDTPDPAGGIIRKDPKTGLPNGQMIDTAADLVIKFYPKPTTEEGMAGILRVQALNNSNGLTSINEASAPVSWMQTYHDLYDQGKLNTRVDLAFNVEPGEPLDQAEKDIAALGPPGHQFGDGMFRADEIGEVSIDGADLTALLRGTYAARPDYHGPMKISQDQYNKFSAIAAKHGYRLRPHVVGDGAMDEALAAFEYANAQTPITEKRWMVDHDFLVDRDQYPRIKKLGVILNSQYMHAAELGPLLIKAWGQPMADKTEQYKDWLAAGLMFTGGSDGPFGYYAEPIYEIYGEVTRGTFWGGKLGAEQGITREQAIRSVTDWAAYTTFEEKVKGSIEPGKYGDFVVLSADILTVPGEKIKDIKVLATVLGGRTVWGSLDGAAKGVVPAPPAGLQ